MFNKIKLLLAICILPACAMAQGGRVTSDPIVISGSGRPIGGARVSVCQPATINSAVANGSLLVLTMASNPVTLGYASGGTLWISGYSGGDAVFNAGTLANGILTGGLPILAVSPTTITLATSITHTSGSTGLALQVGNSTLSCAGLSTLYTDASLSTTTTNPLVSDGYGNYGAGIAAGTYYSQIYGSGVTTTLRQFVVNAGSGISGSILAGQTVYGSNTNVLSGGTIHLDMAGIAGADLGAKMNNCITQLAGSSGICDGSNLGIVTLSTPVNTGATVSFYFCGQQITQTAAITLTGVESIIGCPGRSTALNKGANLNQITFTNASSRGVISGLTIEGNRATPYTGNGIVLNGSTYTVIQDNTIDEEATDDISDIAGQFNTITKNTLTGFGVHAYEGSATPFYETVSENTSVDDGTATGANYIADSASGINIVNNPYTYNYSGYPAIDFSLSNYTSNITGNTHVYASGADTIAAQGASNVSGNQVSSNGFDAIHIHGGSGGFVSNNIVSSFLNGIVLDGANNLSVVGNSVALNDSGGGCGIEVTGDSLSVSLSDNNATLSASGADFGACVVTTSGHMLNVLINNLQVVGFSVSGSYAFRYNNAGNLSANVSGIFKGITCVHVTACYDRTDTQNNANIYEDAAGDEPLDAGTGSSNDIFIQTSSGTTLVDYATLPSPAGNGSRIFCRSCTNMTPTAGSGSGAIVSRENGVWSGWPIDSTGKLTGSLLATSGNCASSASPAVCGSAASGSANVAAAASTVVVDTTAVTANSVILLTPDYSLGTKLSVTCNTGDLTNELSVSARSAGVSFTVKDSGTPSVNPDCFSYLIVN